MKNKKYNYFYDGRAIPKKRFEDNVPENWENETDEFGEFSWGSYRAVEIDG